MAPGLTPGGRTRRIAVTALIAVLAVALVVSTTFRVAPSPVTVQPEAGFSKDAVTVVAGEPSSIDPARHGDAASAAVVAQLFESLTAIDPSLTLRPALAQSWSVEQGSRSVVFTLRPGLEFSDGTPLRAADVVRSWQRLLDPDRRSPLATLLRDVQGVDAVLAGEAERSTVGITADGDLRVVVTMARPAGDFPAIVAAPPFAIVPPSVRDGDVQDDVAGFVGSGAYTIRERTSDGYVLAANDRYWAGRPPIATVNLTTSLGGESPVDVFQAGTADYVPISAFDANWIAYDEGLGPQLRQVPSLSVELYGFDTSQPPFDDVRVRRAFAEAVDWRRLASLDEPGISVPATGMVPAGIPGRPDGDFLPPFDPAAARSLLAEAGYADRSKLPPMTFVTSGGSHDQAVVAQLRENLGVQVDYETMDFDAYSERLRSDPPSIWSLVWVADFPGSNDFLGVLLGPGEAPNYGRYASPAFDAAITRATSAGDPTAATSAYADALRIVRDEAPVVPVTYGQGWALARTGLLGAQENGQGIMRLAGLAWRTGS